MNYINISTVFLPSRRTPIPLSHFDWPEWGLEQSIEQKIVVSNFLVQPEQRASEQDEHHNQQEAPSRH